MIANQANQVVIIIYFSTHQYTKIYIISLSLSVVPTSINSKLFKNVKIRHKALSAGSMDIMMYMKKCPLESSTKQ